MRAVQCLAACVLFYCLASFTVVHALEDALSPAQIYARGSQLFTGGIPLHGRIVTHMADMPPKVIRCANCHSYGSNTALPRSNSPAITREFLLLPISRRGGPDSRYDRDSLCTLLQRGVDPVNIVISTEMPRYSIRDADCDALWSFLTTQQP